MKKKKGFVRRNLWRLIVVAVLLAVFAAAIYFFFVLITAPFPCGGCGRSYTTGLAPLVSYHSACSVNDTVGLQMDLENTLNVSVIIQNILMFNSYGMNVSSMNINYPNGLLFGPGEDRLINFTRSSGGPSTVRCTSAGQLYKADLSVSFIENLSTGPLYTETSGSMRGVSQYEGPIRCLGICP